ncbi:MAG: hypothetical protein SNJ74_03165 [Fimbriimonadaceae bacterium]
MNVLAGLTFLVFTVVLLLGVMLAFAFSIKVARKAREADPLEAVHSENRARIAPIRNLMADIRALVDEHGRDPTIGVIGREAIADSKRVFEQCVRMLSARDSLLRASGSRVETDREIARLESLLASSSSVERPSLEIALAARREERRHHERAGDAIVRIDAQMRQAEAVLSELKTRLSLAVSTAAAPELEQESLAETLSRLKSLGDSLDEAVQVFQGHGQ